jgi:hypothetical protein
MYVYFNQIVVGDHCLAIGMSNNEVKIDSFNLHYVRNSNRRCAHIHIRDEPLNEHIISSKMRRAYISEERN